MNYTKYFNKYNYFQKISCYHYFISYLVTFDKKIKNKYYLLAYGT